MRHFLEVDDLDAGEIVAVLDLAEREVPPQVLAGRGAALVFEKPSLRTRSATEMAVVQLGGHPVMIGAAEVGLGTRETAEDVVRTLAAYHAVVAARVFGHDQLERMAAVDAVPVVNLLSDRSHPMQALADLLTLRQHFGTLAGLTVAYVGDSNNVSTSLALAVGLTGGRIRLGCPPGYGPDPIELERAAALGVPIEVFDRPEAAVAGADAVYTDVWTSMGREHEADDRLLAFEGFTVDGLLMSDAAPHAVFLHCLPAHRGEEVSAEVLESHKSLVWLQAANRMHTARGLLAFLLGPAWSAPERR
ncbi:MAG: ornithine carbamoyltransferase [Acidimicrobiia bacterium]